MIIIETNRENNDSKVFRLYNKLNRKTYVTNDITLET